MDSDVKTVTSVEDLGTAYCPWSSLLKGLYTVASYP